MLSFKAGSSRPGPAACFFCSAIEDFGIIKVIYHEVPKPLIFGHTVLKSTARLSIKVQWLDNDGVACRPPSVLYRDVNGIFWTLLMVI